MIDAKQAIAVAKEKATDYYAGLTPELEEIERGEFQGKASWSITLSFPDADQSNNSIAAIVGRRNRRYKRFVIAADTGEFLAMQIRSVAA